METYDPSKAPDPDAWLALPEEERLERVMSFHEADEGAMEAELSEGHAIVHTLVENQIAMALEPVPVTVEKLMRQGLSRHEAIHAVGAVLTELVWAIQQPGGPEWDGEIYRQKLEKLTAKRWRKGQW